LAFFAIAGVNFTRQPEIFAIFRAPRCQVSRQIKWYGDAGYLLCRGKRKASAELGLSFLGYNMKRAIKQIGTEKMLMMLGD